MDNAQNKKIAELIKLLAKELIKGFGGDRLVLGEKDPSIQDALDNGGLFLDMGPEALQIFEKAGIDPYLVYQEALRFEIESKIPRIDFAGANVDELLKEWKGKTSSPSRLNI